LTVEALSAAAFEPFGDVIEAADAATALSINGGTSQRFDDLAHIDTAAAGGRTCLSIFRAAPRPLPLRLVMVERHALGSQAFVPLSPQRFLIVVAPPGPAPVAAQLRCFVAAPGQGVNFAPGTWHHPLIALDVGGDFLVIDRATVDGEIDCDEWALPGGGAWVQGLPP
jgi:ureidoglycolate lyase